MEGNIAIGDGIPARYGVPRAVDVEGAQAASLLWESEQFGPMKRRFQKVSGPETMLHKSQNPKRTHRKKRDGLFPATSKRVRIQQQVDQQLTPIPHPSRSRYVQYLKRSLLERIIFEKKLLKV